MKPAAATAPAGLTPAQVRVAYGFDQITGNGAGQTIAIIDAYADPKIVSDLHAFDQSFGLTDPSLTVKANTTKTDAGWALETALDVEWAHAIAPGANILLVEAKSDSLSDLLSAVDQARNTTGVVAVSMSWGGGEFSGETRYDAHFTTPAGHIGGGGLVGGITILASSGDNGAGVSWPAVSPNVVGVGGTTLKLTDLGKKPVDLFEVI